MHVLILGGTTEGTALTRALAGRPDLDPVLSLAGRTRAPVLPATAHRVGGFGGAEGLSRYLAEERIAAVVDATHPFAARISVNAALACGERGVPLARFTRPPWSLQPGDRWTVVPDLPAAAHALGEAPRRVLLTVGRLGLAAFRAAPQHRYVIRTIDPPDATDLPPEHALVFDRGPFRFDDEEALMRRERIEVVVTKNSGGTAARAKLDAARALGLEVILAERPPAPAGVATFERIEALLAWIGAHGGASPP